MKDVVRDVRPEFAKDIRQRIAPHRESIFLADFAYSAIVAWVIGQADTLRNTASQDLGSVEGIMSVIVGCNQNAR
jgi:hypothetical protein